MFSVSIDPNDLEERRRLSFALAMRADNPRTLAGAFRTFWQAAWTLWTVVAAPPHGRVIGLSLVVLAVLSTADVWVMRVAASSSPEQRISSQATVARTIRTAAVHPVISASMTSAASPF